MHTRIVLATAFGALGLSITASAQELTEREAVRLFLTRSPYAQQLRAGREVVEARTRARSLWPNPEAGFGHEGAVVTQITRVEQSLPLNGRLGLLRHAGSAAVQVASAQAEFDLWSLCSDMRRAFYDLILAQRRETIFSDSLQQQEEVVRILRERERQGEGSLFDRLRAEQEQSDLRAELASTRALMVEARSRLAAYMDGNIDLDSVRAQGQLRAAGDLTPVVGLLQLAIENRQDYQAEKRRQEQFRWEGRAASRLRIPDPAVVAGFKRAEEQAGSRYGPYLGISVAIPLFERGQNRVAEMDAEQRRSSYRQELLDLQIQSEVRGAYAELEMRRQTAEEYRLRLEQQGAQLQQIARFAYEEGELGILELLDSYRVRRLSLLRLAELSAAAKQAEINLERAVGKPVLNPSVLTPEVLP